MTTPVRLRLSRRKGFDLQALSRATNGMEAVKVDRSTAYGNPFIVGKHGTRAYCVELFVRLFEGLLPIVDVETTRAAHRLIGERSAILADLRGKNLACWCALPAPGEPDVCHAAVLLQLANSPICEEVA